MAANGSLRNLCNKACLHPQVPRQRRILLHTFCVVVRRLLQHMAPTPLANLCEAAWGPFVWATCAQRNVPSRHRTLPAAHPSLGFACREASCAPSAALKVWHRLRPMLGEASALPEASRPSGRPACEHRPSLAPRGNHLRVVPKSALPRMLELGQIRPRFVQSCAVSTISGWIRANVGLPYQNMHRPRSRTLVEQGNVGFLEPHFPCC